MPSSITVPNLSALGGGAFYDQFKAIVDQLTNAKADLDVVRSAAVALTDADQTIAIGTSAWFTQTAALTANRAKTLGTTGAKAGDTIEITRTDGAAFTLAVINGGAGGGTLFTMAASKLGYARCQFDGTNWALKAFGVQ